MGYLYFWQERFLTTLFGIGTVIGGLQRRNIQITSCGCFEDMKKDPAKEIRRVADFLGLERTDEEILKVTERTSFSSMKAESKKRNDTANKKDHFRSGKSGGWSSFMSPEVIAEFDAKTEKLYADCGLRFTDK